jgi:hypothetical protein
MLDGADPDMIPEVTDGQRVTLELLLASFLRRGKWPNYAFLDQQLDREGIQLNAELETLPQRMIAPDSRPLGGGVFYQEGDKISLMLRGLAACRHAEIELAMFAATIQWAVRERDKVEIDPDEVTHPSWRASEALLAMEAAVGAPLSLYRAKLVLELMRFEQDLPSWSGIPENFPEWELQIPREIRRYRDVRSLAAYLGVREEFERARIGPQRPIQLTHNVHRPERDLDTSLAAAIAAAELEVPMLQKVALATERRIIGTSRASVFISYAHEDQEFVLALVEALLRHKLDVRYDRVVLRVGDSLIRAIAREIKDGDFLIAVVSPASIQSEWCQTEVALARTDGINQKRAKVLPVRLRGAPMPEMLGDTLWADADKQDVRALATQLAQAIEGHLGDSAALPYPTSDAEERPTAAERAQAADIDFIADCVHDVLSQWGRSREGAPTADLEDEQRRLRFALDRLPMRVAGALPLVTDLAEAAWAEYFRSRTPRDAEAELREEIRSVRSQVVQGLPVTRRWEVIGGGEEVPTSRDAAAYRFEIGRGNERRKITILISRSALQSEDHGLPAEIVEAKRTSGRSALGALISIDDPPDAVLVTTAGVRWPID